MKQVTFEELPQPLRERVTGWASVESAQYEVLICEMNEVISRCIIKYDCLIGIFENSNLCTWLTDSDIKFLAESLGITGCSMQRKGGSAKSEAKAKSSRENGKKGGRPRKNKEG